MPTRPNERKPSIGGRKFGSGRFNRGIILPKDPVGRAVFDGIQARPGKVIHSGDIGKALKMPPKGDMEQIVAIASLKNVSPELLKAIVKRSFSVEDILKVLSKIPMP